LNLVNIVTGSSANEWIDGISLGGPAAPHYAYVDDLYLCSVLTAFNNTFLGPVRVTSLVPVADGALSPIPLPGHGWTPIGAPHFSLVDEIPPDDGTTKLVWDSLGVLEGEAADGYHYDPSTLPFGGSILAIQGVMDTQETGINARGVGAGLYFQLALNPAVNYGSVGYRPTAVPWSTWRMCTVQKDFNTDTGVPWVLADFTLYDFGPYSSQVF
jgi:hypothetical protein